MNIIAKMFKLSPLVEPNKSFMDNFGEKFRASYCNNEETLTRFLSVASSLVMKLIICL